MSVIAISGLPCAGSSTIAKYLSKELKLAYFSPGSYIKKKLGGDNPKLIANAYHGYLNSSRTQKAIDRMQIMKAKNGNIVIDGKLSIYILNEISNVNIWLYADVKCRADRLCQKHGISYKDAKELLSEREESEVETWRKTYCIEFDSLPKYSNLVFDTRTVTHELILEKTIEKLKGLYNE